MNLEKFYWLNDAIKSVYPYNEYTLTELLCKFYEELKLGGASPEEIANLIRDMINNGEINIETMTEQDVEKIVRRIIGENPDQPVVVSGGSESLSLISYASENGIDTSSDWYSALNSAIQYCIANKRSLFIPNGEYNISQPINITSTQELGLVIRGESQEHCILKFATSGFIFDNGIQTIDYSQRVRFVTIKDLTVRKQIIDFTGDGIKFTRHGYITLENVRIRDFEKGLSLINGSEDLIQNCTILGNKIGIYLNHPINDSTGHDLGLIEFNHCMIHNNYQNTMLIDSVREVTFINCAIMDYHGSCVLNGITNSMTFLGCVFENSNYNSDSVCDSSLIGTPIPDLEINSSGTINIYSCQFANNYSKKIWVKSNVKLNLRDNLFQAVPKPIYINADVDPRIQNSDPNFIGYWCEGNVYRNFTLPPLINIANKDFKYGTHLPFATNIVTSGNNTTQVTSDSCITFDRKQDNDIMFSFNLEKPHFRIEPQYVEVICTNNCATHNLLWVQFKDGTYKHNFEIGGADARIGEFTKNGQTWNHYLFKLPYNDPKNPITMIAIVVPKATATTTMYIDCINMYGNGTLDRLYSDGVPMRSYLKKGMMIWAKDPETQCSTQSSSAYYLGWVITSDGVGTSAPSYKKAYFNMS